MRSFITTSLIILLIYTNLYGGEVDKKLHEKCLYPTVYVGQAGKGRYGSGVIVRSEKFAFGYKNVFLTCAHLVDESDKDYEVKRYIYEDWSQIKEVKSYPAVFVGCNKDMDIAIGVFKSEEEMPVAKLNFDPKIFIGNEVYRIGCGLGDDPRLDYGKITYYKKNPKPSFRTSVMTIPGDSGSPLFHKNKVIGIMVSVRSYRNLPIFNISYAVPLERFKQWDNENNNYLSFAWDKNKKIPELQFRYLQFMNYEISK